VIPARIHNRYSPRPGEPEEIMSNAAQEQRNREYCVSKGYTVVQVENEEALSGMDDRRHPDPEVAVQHRPILLRTLEAVQPGDVVVCRWRNRLSREQYIQEYIERVVAWQGGIVEAADENNESGLGPELERSVRACMDRDYVRKIRWMTSRAMQRHQNVENRLMGRPDRPPFGFRVDADSPANRNGNPGLLIENPAEQEAIAIICLASRQGLKARAICRELDARGFSRRGKSWIGGENTVKAILKRNNGKA
jgi:hypothetical protein